MAIVVKLINGSEERFEPYEGCVNCAAVEITEFGYCRWTGGRQTRCAACGYSKQIDNDSEYAKRGRFNPKVVVDGSMGLKVMRRDTVVGFFPSGSWCSYREAAS